MGELHDLERHQRYDRLIEVARERVAGDPRALEDRELKGWIGRRWRNLFLTEAERDDRALGAARGRIPLPGIDRRTERRRLAERFLTGEDRLEWQLQLPPPTVTDITETTLMFCPGLINGLLPVRAFQDEFPAIEAERGWRLLRSDAHPMRGCEANVSDLSASMEEGTGADAKGEDIPDDEREPPGDVVLLGYSKGAPDALTLIARRPDLAERVRAVVTWGGAVGGSPLADDAYNTIAGLDLGATGAVINWLQALYPLIRMDERVRRFDEYDVKTAFQDLTTTVRDEFLVEEEDAFDALNLPTFSLLGSTKATEVPLFSVQGALQLDGIEKPHDMQVPASRGRVPVPLATDLAIVHAHHWDITYAPFPRTARLGSPNLDHQFPRQAALVATMLVLAELGIVE